MGGGAMRVAAKVAGISTFSTAFRATPTGVDTPAMVAARKVIRPVFTDQAGLKIEQAAQRPAWELDDLEIAGGCTDDEIERAFVADKTEEMSTTRLVFGPPPTLEESQQATTELKDALELVYLSSPKSTGSASSPKSAGSLGSLSSLPETKACITHDSSASKGAMQAFMLLKESPVAQTVVASIASDPNVWKAVMQNPKLLEYLESDKKYADLEAELFKSSAKADAVAEDFSSNSFIDSRDDAEESGEPDVLNTKNTFIQGVKSAVQGVVQGVKGTVQGVKGTVKSVKGVKGTVVDMVARLTSYFESLFTVADSEKMVTDDSPKAFITGGSFMALAMMVIMVVLLKRI